MNDQNFYYKNNRSQQLRGFCYAAQYSSISKAAKLMGLSQSSVSHQIKTLGEDMSVTLFERYGPTIRLTAEGKKLFDYALPIVDKLEHLKNLFREEIDDLHRTELRAAVNSTTLNFVMPSLAKSYVEHFSDHYIYLHYAEHEEAINKVMSEEVDFALLPQRAHMPFPRDVRYSPLFYYKPCLITRKDHPLAGRAQLTVQEICEHELTLPASELRVIPNLYDIFPEHNINKKLRINFVNWETTRKYIEEGLVISISSDVIIEPNDSLMATPLLHLFEPVNYGIVTKRGKKHPQKVQKFIKIAKQAAHSTNEWYWKSI